MARDRAADAARLRRELAERPADAVAWHNLAAAEGDLGNLAEAEHAARRAIAAGIQAPETRLVLARALLGQGKLDDAERAFEAALEARAAYPEAHLDLAQLRWMRTGDARSALAGVDRALRASPAQPGLHLVRSIALEYTGDPQAALAAAEEGLRDAPREPQLLRQAAHLCAAMGNGVEAVRRAREAVAVVADEAGRIVLCESLLAAGHAREAEAEAAALCAAQPLDQHAIALRACAWRLLGDPRYRTLHDYGALVASRKVAAPTGWPSVAAFLEAVAGDLASLHRFRAHPFQQSVRGGSQLMLHPELLARPTLRALFEAIEASARPWLAGLGPGDDPFRRRNTGRFQVTGAWSVQLASGGFHADHVHPRGWLSGVFYVDVPAEVAGADPQGPRPGWLRLGKPGIRTRPPLEADGFVKPEAGVLVLFPAYVWHGVEPFAAGRSRLTLAFDALPA